MSDSDIKVVISQKGTIPVYTVTKNGDGGEIFTDETLAGKGNAENPLKISDSVIQEIHNAGRVIDVTVNNASVVRNKVAQVIVPTKVSELENDEGFLTEISWSEVQEKPSFATVATTGDYEDLTNKPIIPAAQVNSDWEATSGVAKILNKPILGSMANESASDYTKTSNLAAVALSGEYSDLSGKPTIPTVNNATLTIQKNGTTVNTFTANSNTDVTVDILVPTKTSDITNDSGYITAPTITYNPATEELTIS